MTRVTYLHFVHLVCRVATRALKDNILHPISIDRYGISYMELAHTTNTCSRIQCVNKLIYKIGNISWLRIRSQASFGTIPTIGIAQDGL
jgi:hypothetical protein